MKRSVHPINQYGRWRKGTVIVMDSMTEVEAFLKSRNRHESFEIKLCLDFIKNGDSFLNKEIAEKAELWKNLAFDMEPRFSLLRNWNRTEVSDVFDAGAIAANEERPCFTRNRQSDQVVNEGKGEGAYRVIINTDVPWWCEPSDGGAAMGALCMILQELAPVEIWIQQGWLAGSHIEDGVTLFPVHRGGPFTPPTVAFWTSHQYKDSPFSYTVNRLLGRRGSGVAVAPQLDTNLFMSGFQWPHELTEAHCPDDRIGKTLPDEVKAGWVADTIFKMLFLPTSGALMCTQGALSGKIITEENQKGEETEFQTFDAFKDYPDKYGISADDPTRTQPFGFGSDGKKDKKRFPGGGRN